MCTYIIYINLHIINIQGSDSIEFATNIIVYNSI